MRHVVSAIVAIITREADRFTDTPFVSELLLAAGSLPMYGLIIPMLLTKCKG